LEAGGERHSRAAAPRRKGPLEEVPGKNFLERAKRWMDYALTLRNRGPVKAAGAAMRAFGFYLAAEKSAFSEKSKANCLVGAGTALSLAASLCEKRDPRRAGRLHEDAGDHLYRGAKHGTMPEGEAIRLAREQYARALELGGNVRVLVRKVSMCDRASGE